MIMGNDNVYIERKAVDAVLRVVHLLVEAGDSHGALRELEHFVGKMQERVLVPLEEAVKSEIKVENFFPWLVKSRPDRFKLPA